MPQFDFEDFKEIDETTARLTAEPASELDGSLVNLLILSHER